MDSFVNFVRSRSISGLLSVQEGMVGNVICWVSFTLKFISFRSGVILSLIGLGVLGFFCNIRLMLVGVLKRQLNTGFSGVALILIAYCNVSCFLLSSKGNIEASACRLVSGEVRNAPRASLRPWF